jgi:hypothetical protein
MALMTLVVSEANFAWSLFNSIIPARVESAADGALPEPPLLWYFELSMDCKLVIVGKVLVKDVPRGWDPIVVVNLNVSVMNRT